MSRGIETLRIIVFVPNEVTPLSKVAETRAGTYAHYAAGMATPVVRSVTAVSGGHEIELIEQGDVAAHAAARLEKA